MNIRPVSNGTEKVGSEAIRMVMDESSRRQNDATAAARQWAVRFLGPAALLCCLE